MQNQPLSSPKWRSSRWCFAWDCAICKLVCSEHRRFWECLCLTQKLLRLSAFLHCKVVSLVLLYTAHFRCIFLGSEISTTYYAYFVHMRNQFTILECFMIQSKNTKKILRFERGKEREKWGGMKPRMCLDMIGWRWLHHSLIWKSLIQRGNTIWQNTQNLFSEFTWWCCYTRSGWVLSQSASCELVPPFVLSFPTGGCFHSNMLKIQRRKVHNSFLLLQNPHTLGFESF